MFVVFGATGQTGSVVADTLLEKKLPVRVVLRSDKGADAWRAKGADVAFADVIDADAITKALDGAIAIPAILSKSMCSKESSPSGLRIEGLS
jgi:uncharacterized protein YbjT (DUF2867 family)